MSKVGFKPTWMKDTEEEDGKTGLLEQIQNFANQEQMLSPAHLELVARIQSNEIFMTSSKFSELAQEEKEQVLGNYKWLVCLNAQLGGQ